MDTCIVHVDIDAFFASVEQILVPKLRSRPVAVGSGCIASCSYEARRFGLHAGMPLAEARKKCPRLVVLPGSYGIYRCFASRVWEICREVAPAIETYLDDAYLDFTGTELLYGNLPRTVTRLRRRIRSETGLTLTAGIGPNRMIAKLAGKSVKPDGMKVVRNDEVERFLVNRPVTDIPGVGHKTAATLHKFNIYTVRDARTLTRDTFIALFGKTGSAIYDRARGRDTRAVSEREIPKTISRETTFYNETTDCDEITGMLHYLVERAMKAARQLGLVTNTVTLKIRYADFKGETGRRRLAAPTNLEPDVFSAALGLLGRLHTRRVGLRLVGVELSGFSMDDTNCACLFDPNGNRKERLARALDEVRRRFGFSAITVGRSLNLLGKLQQDDNGYVLRTPCLTK